MKKLILLSCCMYAFASYSQTILKVDVPSSGKATYEPISPKKQSVLDSINKKLNLFNANLTQDYLNNLRNALNDTSIQNLTEVKQLRIKLDSIKSSQMAGSVKIAGSPKLDSLKMKDTAITGDSACPKLTRVSIKFLFGDNNEYIGVIADTAGNALATFVISQLNKELFYDKLKKALETLCDTASVRGKISIFKGEEPDLYTRFLEAKEDFANTNGLAGTLKIYRNVLIHSGDRRKVSVTNTNTAEYEYPDIKSIKKAKKISKNAYDAAVMLRGQLDTLATAAMAAAQNSGDKYIAARIFNMSREVHSSVEKARSYRDSINNKIPDDQILRLYNKAIQMSRKAGAAASKAMDVIREASGQLDPPKAFRKADLNVQYASFEPGGYIRNNSAMNVDTPGDAAGGIAVGHSSVNDSTLTIQEIQIQFQDGFIENIKIFGKLAGNGHLFRFENTYPIGFSTKKDFKRLIDMRLEERSDYLLYDKSYLILGDVIAYNQNLANNNKDYSPANQVITIKALPDSIKEIALYKDQTSKILELQVFSDLKGADNNNPNGLIQIEMNKRLNFFSRRSNISWQFLHRNKVGKSYESFANVGFFNFVTPQFSINKIESNQKRLILSHIDTLTLAADTSKPITYTSTINILRHQIYNVGFDLSCLLIDAPNIKSTINMGVGLHFGRSAIQDTLKLRDKTGLDTIRFHPLASNNVLEYGVNTFQWGPFVTWQIFPDSRFGISATQRFTWFNTLNSNFVQVRDSAHYLKFIANTPRDQVRTTPYSTSKCVASAEIFAYFSSGNDGNNKLFFRYRLNWDVTNPKENFHQVQVGFSTCITATKEYDKLKKAANLYSQ